MHAIRKTARRLGAGRVEERGSGLSIAKRIHSSGQRLAAVKGWERAFPEATSTASRSISPRHQRPSRAAGQLPDALSVRPFYSNRTVVTHGAGQREQLRSQGSVAPARHFVSHALDSRALQFVCKASEQVRQDRSQSPHVVVPFVFAGFDARDHEPRGVEVVRISLGEIRNV